VEITNFSMVITPDVDYGLRFPQYSPVTLPSQEEEENVLNAIVEL
jgi:hypothetical protein